MAVRLRLCDSRYVVATMDGRVSVAIGDDIENASTGIRLEVLALHVSQNSLVCTSVCAAMNTEIQNQRMRRIIRLATFSALVSLTGGVPTAAADGIEFELDMPSTRRVVPAGTLHGGKVEIELLTQPGGSDHQMMRINVLRHDKKYDYAMHQKLADMYCTSPFSAKGDGKTITIGCTIGRFSNDQHITEWEWVPKQGQYVQKRTYRVYPYREDARTVEKLLAAGQWDQALKRLEKIDIFVDSAHRSLATYWFMRFVAAMRPGAETLHRAGKKREAAALLAKVLHHDLFREVPMEPARLLEVDLRYFPCCEDGYDERSRRRGRGPFKKTVYEINEAGYLLQQGGRNSDAVTLLTPLVAKVPQRTVAHLNLADALFALNHTEKAKSHYRIYVQQRRKAGKSIPRRATERAGL